MKSVVERISSALSRPAVALVASAALSRPAFADGFQKASGLLEKVEAGLSGLALVTVTLATLWVGYKVLFGGSTIKECSPVIIGAIVIASASEVASMMVN